MKKIALLLVIGAFMIGCAQRHPQHRDNGRPNANCNVGCAEKQKEQRCTLGAQCQGGRTGMQNRDMRPAR
ncbi:MAG: hypothetical protein LUC34_07860 [Campylobacter sp.]|nr:hypothetical protein [Campylobacter sp.]